MSGFHKVEVNKTVWEVPERYQNLTAVGSGAYGQVWYVPILHPHITLIPIFYIYFKPGIS